MIISSDDFTVADLLKGDLKLATPPNIYFALKQIVDDPTKGSQDAAFLIEDDAALSAKLLKIVNSAFYGFPSQITSITRAMSLIGLRELQNLVLSTLIVERFSNLPGQSYSIHDFWARNLRCAILSRELDKLMGNKYADSAFLCGLLHNIGQLLFYLRLPELARQVELLSQSQIHIDRLTLINIEQQIIGFDHYHAGAELCRLWKLPEVFIESICLHAYSDYIGPYSDIAAIIRLADNFSSLEHPYDALNYSSMNLSIEQIDYALEMTNEEFESIFKIFYPVK
jgi:HD-like signal output (HDOD) protein